ncbi:membrane lipoprotein lipid attachment site-containing protein [Anaerobacillus isosaccharinicus]|uniref:Membrane lipoprotein lipid attachment site-containing protein n=1 Tax=Anaerobacillus isosaccharinicus TaxID=1532552 RepID=A0A1S2LIJ2_9BACI|nr:membrane lipoprotein lipid attachment site-containing protein [Anaerobacillus isosaccharinicus]MBA5584720.1 membrane lipoprotein lipid attachment site-containing protein [Anaerobacillus isosaccharinicus]QOY36910.1 membrane lipoprotein lipid attachment site-containing protein [Anaerobacillus isosaccharinicus]
MKKSFIIIIMVLLLAACTSQDSHKSYKSVIELDDLKFEVEDYEIRSSNNPDDKNVQVFVKKAIHYQFSLLNTGIEKIGSDNIDDEKLEVYIEAHENLLDFMEPNLFETNKSNMRSGSGSGSQQTYLNPNEKGEYFFTYIIADIKDLELIKENALDADIVVLLTNSSGISEEIKRITLNKK